MQSLRSSFTCSCDGWANAGMERGGGDVSTLTETENVRLKRLKVYYVARVHATHRKVHMKNCSSD
eukprot:1139915-Pelagomonas_calceolata.AAC.2